MLVALPPPAPIYKAAPRAKREPWRELRTIAERREARLRRELQAAFETVREAVDLDALEEALTLQRVQSALDVVGLDALQQTLIAPVAIVREAFLLGAGVAGEQLLDLLFPARIQKADEQIIVEAVQPHARLYMRFDLDHPAAAAWANQNAGRLIANISEETRKGVQRLIVRGIDEGIPPKPLAKLIRNAGIGLTQPQAGALLNYRKGLLKAGAKPERVDLLIDRRGKKMLQYRALVIARHELLSAANAGQSQLWDASVKAGLLPSETKRQWILTPDDRLCPLCSQMRGEIAVTGMDQPWQTPRGPVLIPQQIHVQCRCAQGLKIDLGVARAQAQQAIAAPSPELQRLLGGVFEPPSMGALPPGMVAAKPTPPPPPASSLESAAVASMRKLGGGINATNLVDLEGEGKAVFKPQKGEKWVYQGSAVRFTVSNKAVTLAQREVAAYRVDQILGTNLVPETVYRTIDKVKGSLQRFVSGALPDYEYRRTANARSLTLDELHRFTVLDVLIGNADRHRGNYMRVVADGRPVAIDHGYAFPAARSVESTKLREQVGLVEFRSEPAEFLGRRAISERGLTLPAAQQADLLTRLRDDGAWATLLDDYKFSPAERLAFEARRRWLIKHVEANDLADQFREYRGFGFAPEE